MRGAPCGRDAAPGSAVMVVREGAERWGLSCAGTEVQHAEVGAWCGAVDRRMLFYTMAVRVDILHPRTAGIRPSRLRAGWRVVSSGGLRFSSGVRAWQ